jgi:hypothetical protein
MNFLIVPLLAKIEKEIDPFLEEFLKANKFWVQNLEFTLSGYPSAFLATILNKF